MAITGTSGKDVLIGTIEAELLSGLGDNDLVNGGVGDDTIQGDAGKDTLIGGIGDDSLLGGNGNDFFAIDSSHGDDTMRGGDGNDTFFEFFGLNQLFGDAGDDVFHIDEHFVTSIDSGSSTITGGSGRDLYVIRQDTDETFHGHNHVVTDFATGAGGDLIDLNELIDYTAARNGYAGGSPFDPDDGMFQLVDSDGDTLVQWGALGHGMPTWLTVLTLEGVTAADLTAANFVGEIDPTGFEFGFPSFFFGSDKAEVFIGSIHFDSISGEGGNDSLNGGLGNDLVKGNAGHDTLIGGIGDDSLLGGSGDDIFAIANSHGDDTMRGGDGDDTFFEFYGQNQLFGDAGNDVFHIDEHYVTLENSGSSTIAGGSGRDLYVIHQDTDETFHGRNHVVTDFAAGTGGDLIDLNELIDYTTARNGYAGGNPFDPDDGMFQLVDSDGDTLVQWGALGHGSPGWLTVLTLENMTAADLTAANFVGEIDPTGFEFGFPSFFFGSDKAEVFIGSIHFDSISGEGGNDSLNGGLGNDLVKGNAGHDTLIGGIGNDSLLGGSGDDIFAIANSQGDDTMRGGDGNDTFFEFYGLNQLFGEAGDDVFHIDEHFVTSIDSGSSTITGGSGRDLYVIRQDADETFHGHNHVVTDFVAGPDGDVIDLNQLIDYSAVHNALPDGDLFAEEDGIFRLVQSGADTLLDWGPLGPGMPTWLTVLTLLNVTASDIAPENFVGRLVVGTSGDDSLAGGASDDTVLGLAGNDTLEGGGGADELDGGEGADSMAGGEGDDLYHVDDAGDIVEETSNPGALVLPGSGTPGLASGLSVIGDTVRAAINYSIANLPFIENIQLTGAASRATGNSLGNDIRGNAGNDTLIGAAGNDTMDGGSGADRLLGGLGNDRLIWGSGDRIDGGVGSDTLVTRASLDLTRIDNSSIKSIEQIDLLAAGGQTLTLDASDVLDLSEAINRIAPIRVLGTSADVVDIVGSFTRGGVSGQFRNYSVGSGLLQVDTDIVVS